ncbi:cytidine deaminase [Peptoanaerobacter stomatis]|uniref:Cytidine deaminase n=1 Tax=Peptoanaerobacter stomatis TaxID=796937 RepID=J6HGQ0_9FIRM|nr:cytidine deaminase [Peptoanaerobacter stomatis]EJU24130.1 cytidine deaminase [Peptoanaerobacter stomatis]NWO24183.1 cytidine deaminase [Peptostreptococcaceae bacterium oral taxon 081]
MNKNELIRRAFEARENAYTPYSNFKVGAALLAKNGKIYQGCNVENATYSPTNCAERTAFFKAVSEGVREFDAIAIVGGLETTKEGEFEYTPPCGVCRQVMMEFCDYNNFIIILAKSERDYKEYKLSEIMPLGFNKNNLNN